MTLVLGKKDELHLSVILQSAEDFLNEFKLFLNLSQNQLLSFRLI